MMQNQTFDTYEQIQNLKTGGFTEPQAVSLINAIKSLPFQDLSHFYTREEAKVEMASFPKKEEVTGVITRQVLKEELADFVTQSELKAEIAELKSELKMEISELRHYMDLQFVNIRWTMKLLIILVVLQPIFAKLVEPLFAIINRILH